jgi:hypothetical protein
MKRKHLVVGPFVIALLTMAGPAMAQSPAPSPGHSTQAPAEKPAPTFKDLDKKGVGYLVRSDLPKDVPQLKKLRLHFDEADLNHDGRISGPEYNAYLATTYSGSVPDASNDTDSSSSQSANAPEKPYEGNGHR